MNAKLEAYIKIALKNVDLSSGFVGSGVCFELLFAKNCFFFVDNLGKYASFP